MENEAIRAIKLLNDAGFSAYLVGGSVRDQLMGYPPGDIDLATSAQPQQIISVFHQYRMLEVGAKHGTITVMMDKVPLEITTFRIDGTYSDKRRPDTVTFTSNIYEDLGRRDFTINAMACTIEGTLLDPYGGSGDLENKIIRCVGIADRRFEEDALRILRALRFAAVLDFHVEWETDCAIRKKGHLLAGISRERIWAEIKKMVMGKGIRKVLLDYCDVLAIVIPELLPMKGFQQNNSYHIYDVLEHTAMVVESAKPELPLKLAALFHDISKPNCYSEDEKGEGKFGPHGCRSSEMAETILNRLGCDKRLKERVTTLVKYHDVFVEYNPITVKNWLSKLGPEVFNQLIELKLADNRGQNIACYNGQQQLGRLQQLAQQIEQSGQCYSMKTLDLTGKDLLQSGVPAGQQIGKILNQALDGVIMGAVENEKSQLLRYVESKDEI